MSGAVLTPKQLNSFGSVRLPLLLISALATAVVFQSGIVRLNDGAELPLPPTISVAPGSFAYRQPGEYYRAGYAVDGPKADYVMTAPLTIMKYQVSSQDYDACVADAACPARESGTPSRPDMPATGVSHDDATLYAHWFSKKSGGSGVCRVTSSWPLPLGQSFPMMLSALTRTTGIRHCVGSPTMSVRPRASEPKIQNHSRMAALAKTNMGSPILPGMSGNGQALATDASISPVMASQSPPKPVASSSPPVSTGRH